MSDSLTATASRFLRALVATLLALTGSSLTAADPRAAGDAGTGAMQDDAGPASAERSTPLLGIEMHLDRQSVNEVVQRVLRNVERALSEGGQRAVLGIVAGHSDDRGVRVAGVTPDGPADAAGIRSGDVLLAIDGVSLARTDGARPLQTLLGFLEQAGPGDAVRVHYERDGAERYTDVTLGDLADLPMVQVHGGDRRDLWEGLQLIELTPGLGRYFGTGEGLLVVRTPAQLPLDLREGDVLLAIGARTPLSAGHARQILASYQPGERLVLQLMREQRRIEVSWEVDEGRVPGPAGESR